MKSFFRDAQYIKHNKDKLTKQGQTQSQLAGVRLLQHLDGAGNPVAPGTIITLEDGEVTTYDSITRVIDTQTFNEQLNEVMKRKEELEDVIEYFLKAGEFGDVLCKNIMGPYFEMLFVPDFNGQAEIIRRNMLIDGYDNAAIAAIFKEIKIGGENIDARPSVLSFKVEMDADYNRALLKLRLVLRYCGIVFTGKKHHPNPDMGLTSEEKLFDPKEGDIRKYRPESTSDVSRRKGLHKSADGKDVIDEQIKTGKDRSAIRKGE